MMMMSQEGYDTLESGRHEIMDLELSHIDNDVQLSSSQEDQPRPLNGGPHPYQGDSPVHNRYVVIAVKIKLVLVRL